MRLLTVSNDLKWFPKQPGQPPGSTGYSGALGLWGLEACLPWPGCHRFQKGSRCLRLRAGGELVCVSVGEGWAGSKGPSWPGVLSVGAGRRKRDRDEQTEWGYSSRKLSAQIWGTSLGLVAWGQCQSTAEGSLQNRRGARA